MKVVIATDSFKGTLEAEGYFYAIRLIPNQILPRKIEHLLTLPVGRPPKKPIILYHSFRYRAASWEVPRRVVAKIGAKVVSHSRYVIFQMAEVAVPRILFREILDRIRQLRFLTIPARLG